MITVCGKPATLEDIAKAPMPIPRGVGRFWRGIPHIDLIEAVDDEIRGRGWAVTEQKFSLDKEGANLAGAWDITIPKMEAPAGMGFALGALTSNNQDRKLRLVSGGTVRVCNNGMVTGEILLARKHTTRFDLPAELSRAFDAYIAATERLAAMVDDLRTTFIDATAAEHYLLEAGRRGLMPWSRLGDVDEAWRKPPEAFLEAWGKNTAWALLNAFTYVVKRNPPLKQMGQMNDFRAMLAG